MHRLDSISIVLIAALMCSFMPMNFIVVVAAVFTVLHMYALSLECAVVTLVLLLVLFLLYFRFSPKDTIVVLLTPMSFILGIPYVMPLAMGLLGSPASAVSVGCGVIVTFFIRNIARCDLPHSQQWRRRIWHPGSAILLTDLSVIRG